MKTVALFTILFIAVNAIPLKPNDLQRRMKDAEINSNKDLDRFVEAWNKQDKAAVLEMTTFIIKIAKGGYDHSIQLNKTFEQLYPLLVKLAHSKHTWLMRMVAYIIDGNRDNQSYYDLETVIQWIQKRQDKGVKNDNLVQAHDFAKSSQDHLETMAQTFVKAIKIMRKDASNMTVVMDEVADSISQNGQPFISQYGKAMDQLYLFQQSQV